MYYFWCFFFLAKNENKTEDENNKTRRLKYIKLDTDKATCTPNVLRS